LKALWLGAFYVREFFTAILYRLFPVTDFIYEIADEMVLNPAAFVCRFDAGDRVTIRAEEGQLGSVGIFVRSTIVKVLGLKVRRITAGSMFAETLQLNILERFILEEAMAEWIDAAFDASLVRVSGNAVLKVGQI